VGGTPADQVASYVARRDRAGRLIDGPIAPWLLLRRRGVLQRIRLAVIALARWLIALLRRPGASAAGQTTFCFRPVAPADPAVRAAHLAGVRARARARLAALGDDAPFSLLVTGGTGFVGRELVIQACRDPRVGRIVLLVRPRPPASAEDRVRQLLEDLRVPVELRGKVSALDGDIEAPALGLGPETLDELAARTTHVVHCAATVAFDETVARAFRINVDAQRNVLEVSDQLARTGGRLVAHIAVETFLISGRHPGGSAPEGDLAFPPGRYSNYYELSKACASMEAERYLFERGLPVAHLLPSSVVGRAEDGNNLGDNKVINAPVNFAGSTARAGGTGAWLAGLFPADPAAELNLVPVDRVAEGILRALDAPDAIGARIHIISHQPLTFRQMAQIIREEVGVRIRFVPPGLFRVCARPILGLVRRLRPRSALGKIARLVGVFDGYGETGYPRYEVGGDTRILGLPPPRLSIVEVFRVLCRHNQHVLGYGRVRGLAEIARREEVWAAAVAAIAHRAGARVPDIQADRFAELLSAEVDLGRFEARSGAGSAPPGSPA
jgi:nucleoside-diphosphate-sugar epimerase